MFDCNFCLLMWFLLGLYVIYGFICRVLFWTLEEIKAIKWVYVFEQNSDTMGSKAPGWGEQWSAEGHGGNDDDDKLMNKVGNSSGSKMRDVKAAASKGLSKAKAAASMSAQKVKSGTSVGIKWVKNQYQKKVSKWTKICSFDWMNENLYLFQKNNQEHFTWNFIHTRWTMWTALFVGLVVSCSLFLSQARRWTIWFSFAVPHPL